ncbi:MAG: hypothetical protein WCE48_04000 [Steroidobacteraceae bacterium]
MRVLFVPVSAPRGSGEYTRALTLATALARRSPGAQLHFILSREAPYAQECPFPATLLPSSPTFHTREVSEVIRNFRPAVVVFDNAGRTAQLLAARASGARVVFISSRPRQRRRAFRLRWMRLLDEHWIAYPEFMAGSLTAIERLRLTLAGGPVVRFLDCVLPESGAAMPGVAAAQGSIPQEPFALVVAGGVSGHRRFQEAPRAMAEAAVRLARRDLPVVLVDAAAGAAPIPTDVNLSVLPRLGVGDLAGLIRRARLVVCNGGDTFVQVLASGRPCVAVALVPDQSRRLRRCARAGLALEARRDATEIEEAAVRLLQDEWARATQLAAIQQLGLVNGLDTALMSLAALAALAPPARSAARRPAPPSPRGSA